jgi:hypothetical protein
MRIVTHQEFDVVMGTIMGTLVPHSFLWHACCSTCHLQHPFGAPPPIVHSIVATVLCHGQTTIERKEKIMSLLSTYYPCCWFGNQGK